MLILLYDHAVLLLLQCFCHRLDEQLNSLVTVLLLNDKWRCDPYDAVSYRCYEELVLKRSVLYFKCDRLVELNAYKKTTSSDLLDSRKCLEFLHEVCSYFLCILIELVIQYLIYLCKRRCTTHRVGCVC